MTIHAYFQGLKKAVFGLFIWIGILPQLVEDTEVFTMGAFNSWFPGFYLLLLILYLVIDTFYKQRKLTKTSDSLARFNGTQIVIGVILTVVIGAILHWAFQPTIYVGTLALAILFFIVWALENRRHNFLGLFALALMIIALLPLLPLDTKLASVLPAFSVGLIMILAGIIDHQILIRQLDRLGSD